MSQNIHKIYLKIFGHCGVTTNFDYWMSTDKLKTYYNKEIELTNDNNYTHAIIINTCMPELNIPKENVIGFSHEPNPILFGSNYDYKISFIEYVKKNVSKYYLGDKEDLPDPFIEGQIFYIYNKTHFFNQEKINFCSMVISHKNNGLNYNYRHQLVDAILKTNLPIDIYGSGLKYFNHINDNRLKFPLEGTSDDFFGKPPFENYDFHICIENVVSNYYFSEKICNPLLSNSIPIYYGCRNIDKFFDNIIKLTGNIDDDILLLNNIFLNQETFKNNKKNNYEEILNKLNLFNHLHNFFDDIEIL
jgi:hypothetical protein